MKQYSLIVVEKGGRITPKEAENHSLLLWLKYQPHVSTNTSNAQAVSISTFILSYGHKIQNLWKIVTT